MSFVEKLTPEALEFFNTTAELPFSQQAIAFLNAYWDEIGDQADFIFSLAWETMKYVDKETKKIEYEHLYDEGNVLEFNIGIFFYEQLLKNYETGGAKGEFKEFQDEKYKKSFPEIMTSIKRKKEIREHVDANDDNKISMLEHLLYQYKSVAGIEPVDFCDRLMKAPEEHPEVKKARLALEEVSKSIKAYEAEKTKLEEGAKLPGVKGLKNKNQLAQLDSSPLKENLNRSLITAEAAVRIVSKKFGKGGSCEGDVATRNEGAVWWMNKDIEEKKRKYGRVKK